MRTPTMKRESKILALRIDALKVPRAGVAQRELSQAKGDSIAAEFDMGKFGYPVVNQVDGIHWVIDGQHRMYALGKQPAATRGTTIECEVYENLSEQEMADLFLGRNNARPVTVFERFTVGVTAGHPRENAIMKIVTAAKLEIKRDHQKGCIVAVGGLQRVFDLQGGAILGQVLRTLREAYDAAPNAFGRAPVEGLGLVYERYGSQIDDQALVGALGQDRHGIHGILRRAEEYRERVGRGQPQCVAAAIVDVYNQARKGKARVRRWWRG